ncbi:Heterokaryon incompatibility protein HET [Aspergillus sclerotialis]|uniref:Heterokaryon incompatibility protein HET n=1 Tax=Aspergillus sclerotialis TaxID=2070753 RepID=A0A3A2ZD12_9EURO|nr:Heterokaryon incompatibility protein HET [Aspergillus sclerotialis]
MSVISDASSFWQKRAREIQDASSTWAGGVREAKEISKIALDPSRDQEGKLRSILYTFFRPTIQPRFYDDTKPDEPEQSVGVFNRSSMEPTVRTPVRMIDVDTRNLVPTYNLSRDDRYCMISHSWKGREIDHGYFSKAKQRDADSGIENDVKAVMDQCEEDLKLAEERLEDVLKSCQGSSVKFDSVDDLLCRHTAAKQADGGLASARKKYGEAIANHDNVKKGDQAHIGLLKHLLQAELNSPRLVIRAKAEQQQREMQDMAQAEVKKVEQAVDKAKEDLDRAVVKHNEKIADIKFFEANRQVSYALEDAFGALQRKKSAVKLDNSIRRAKDIFEQKGYHAVGKRYVWLDTCCIDKSNSHELTESLALMGDWYASADFCLVHLDTDRSDEEWLDEWDNWKSTKDSRPPVCIPRFNEALEPEKRWSQPEVIPKFDEIINRAPEWATRGWTLQELVLSKVTYYVNHYWQLLDRPVDILGPYYYICPLIGVYIGNEKLTPEDQKHCEVLKDINALEELSGIKRRDDVNESQPETVSVQKAHMLIVILKLFGFRAPKHINEDNARAHVAQIVRDMTEQLSSRQEAVQPAIGTLEDICKRMGISPEKNEKHVVDMLLRALVDETRELVTKDRKYIAAFSKVEPLKSWVGGTGRNTFSAHRVMMLASDRNCTVETDKAYSLMGILGVQFPAFSAEGLTKALSRVIDEVIITSNDVSVFNWTGEHHGSPLSGRSLYPSNIDAFSRSIQGSGKAERNAKLVEIFERDRLEQPEVAKRINKLLGGVIDSVKYLHDASPVLRWLQSLGDFIKEAIFEELQPNLENLEKLLRFIENVAKSQSNAEEDQGDADAAEKVDTQPEQGSEKNDEQKGNSQGGFRVPKFGAPSLPFNKNGKDQGGLLSKFGKGFGKEENPQSAEKIAEIEAADAKLRDLDQPVDDYIKDLRKCPGPNPVKVPEALAKALEDSPAPPLDADEPRPTLQQKPEVTGKKMICPNPITVTSSGIKGAFDIQRVIINMLQPEKLRLQVKNAASPHEKISGWCTVSTGFALAIVGFSCEKHVLEQQLDVGDVINHTILSDMQPTEDEPDGPKEEKANGSEPAVKEEPTETEAPKKEETQAEGATEASPQEDSNVSSFLMNYGNTQEERKVSRMINFVQEPNLRAVAGEWVLARVSGVPGANWFLCRFELGLGKEFYARRIPTDDFDFYDAVPEKGLFEHWRRYMMTKKDILCSSLSLHLDAKRSGKLAKDLQKKTQPKDQGADQNAGEDEDGESKWANVWNTIELVGWEARRRFIETLAEHREDLEGILGELALKNVPSRLQAAILDFNARKSLLPLMFHSGQQVHMF